MTNQILHLHLGKDATPQETSIVFLNETFHIRSVGTGGDIDVIERLIKEADTTHSVSAIALDGIATRLEVGRERIQHVAADRLEVASIVALTSFLKQRRKQGLLND
jgi:hypothetical protein